MNRLVSWLAGRLVGYPEVLLKVLCVAALAGRSILLIGRHGIGKTTIARCLARVLGYRWVHYDAAKDDLLSVAGLPDPAALAKGRLAFAEHDRSIWDKEVVLLDELTRANKENSNLWLEIIEHRTLQGRELRCRVFIATCNPEGYAASYQLDEALLDRFAIVAELPHFQDCAAPTMEQMVRVNLEQAQEEAVPPEVMTSVRAIADQMAVCRARLLADPALVGVLAAWCGKVTHLLLGKASGKKGDTAARYVSPRTYAHQLPFVFIDLLAYDLAALGTFSPTELVAEARLALRYCFEKKVGFESAVLEDAMGQTQGLLRRWKGLAPDGVRDPLSDLAGGETERRIAALRALALDTLSPQDRSRLDALARRLVLDILEGKDDAQRHLCGRLWEALAPLPEVRRQAELLILRARIDYLHALSPGMQRGRRAAAESGEPHDLASDPNRWAPSFEAWR